MRRILPVILLIMLGTATACTSVLTSGDQTSDDTHAFLLQSVQIIDRISEATAAEGEDFLVIRYEIENLRSQSDSNRQWTDRIRLEADGEYYDATLIETLDGQLWETSLLPNEAKAGYLAFILPQDPRDFRITFSFPTSETEVSYHFRPVDKRIGINVDYVLTRLEQIARTKKIPLIGGLLATFSDSPIRYLGVILVPEEEIAQLMAQTGGLGEDAKRAVIEDYLVEQGHGRLEQGGRQI